VGLGHELLPISIALELAEVNAIHKLSGPENCRRRISSKCSTNFPERCFSMDNPSGTRASHRLGHVGLPFFKGSCATPWRQLQFHGT